MRAIVPGLLGAVVYITHSGGTDSYSTVQHVAPSSKIKLQLSPTSPEQIERHLLVKQQETPKEGKLSRRGWYRRILSKVTLSRSEDTAPNMMTLDTLVDEQSTTNFNDHFLAEDSFILQNIEIESPESFVDLQEQEYIFPSADLQEQEYIFPSADNVNKADVAVPIISESGSPFTRITRKTFEKILTERLDKWSNGANSNMIVECDPTSNILQFMRGQFYCDATINLDRIVFGNFQVSGGQLQAKNFCLNLFSFLRIPLAASPRYPDQFELHAQSMTLTQEDLWESSCIRNGLRRLMNRILKSKGLSSMDINLQSINILPTGKLSCVGKATSLFSPPITFELRTGVGISGRGHILTLPGLELAISPALGFFVPVIPELTIDLGHNAQLLDIVVDVEKMLIKVSACVTITPEHTLRLKEYIQSTDAYGAHCFVDVGQWLTRVGRFAH
jgi:hypothetical protein